jgi:hypothetical protein
MLARIDRLRGGLAGSLSELLDDRLSADSRTSYMSGWNGRPLNPRFNGCEPPQSSIAMRSFSRCRNSIVIFVKYRFIRKEGDPLLEGH